MKRFFLFLMLISTLSAFSQTTTDVVSSPLKSNASNAKTAINLGVLMGGGSLVGCDFEVMPLPRIGIQAGIGISSFGASINYHLKPQINSSFISLQYWKQGFGANFYGSYIGPMFVFRAKKIFQAGIGLGYILNKGTNWPEKSKDLSVLTLYNIGVYFPL